MGLFKNFFGKKKLTNNDPDFGEIESFSTNRNEVGWIIRKKYLNTDIEILMAGTKDGIHQTQKKILLEALNNEQGVKSEAEKALKEQFENADMEFESIEKHFELKGISIRDDGFEMAFLEKERQNYFFNVHFENNKQIGVSIDG